MKIETSLLIISFFVTVILGMIIIPILRKFKVGQIEREDGPKSHLKKQGTPTMGGIMMIIAMILVVTGAYIYLSVNNQGELAHNLLPILLLTIGFGLIGFIDDFKKLVLKNTKGLKPSYKMLGLLIISVAYVVYLVYGLHIGTETYIPFMKDYVTMPVYLYIPFAILVILGTTNAVNLTDGIDGLATSVTTIIIACLTVIGVIFDVKEIILFGAIVCGCNLAFLIFNLHPAKVFMGDTGSLALGGFVAASAYMMRMQLFIPIISFIYLIEVVSVILQVAYFKLTGGKRLFRMAPLHHHFELCGWSETRIVAVFSILTAILCLVALIAV